MPAGCFNKVFINLGTIRLTLLLVSEFAVWVTSRTFMVLQDTEGPIFVKGETKKGKEKASVVSVDRRLELLRNTGVVCVSVCVCVSH